MVEYRGKIPFLLKELKGNILYLCSSNKNIEDYYDVLEDIYGGKLLKLESSQIKEELEKDNYDLLEILKSGDKFIILTSLDAVLRDYFLEGKRFRIEIGKNIDAKTLEEELEKNGYTRNYMVEDRNQFSIRGDIFDIFPKNSEYPVRIEFSFGDEIERVTYFDIETQKSIEKKSSIDMYINSNNEERKTLFSFLGKLDNIHIFMENRELLEYKLGEILKDVGEAEVELRERFQELVNVAEQVEITKFEYDELHSFEDVEYIKKLGTDPRLKIKIVSEEEKRYREIFQGENFEFERYPLFEGYRDGDTLVLTDRELKGVRVKRERRDRGFQRYKNVSEIQEGDYIIHENYGVGIYLGVEIIDGHDYLKIKYADEDKLFVPIEGIGKIGEYISCPGEIPEIYKLGRKGFRKKQKIYRF